MSMNNGPLPKQCPNCNDEGPFNVQCVGISLVGLKAFQAPVKVNWDGNSLCYCEECEYLGKVEDFIV